MTFYDMETMVNYNQHDGLCRNEKEPLVPKPSKREDETNGQPKYDVDSVSTKENKPLISNTANHGEEIKQGPLKDGEDIHENSDTNAQGAVNNAEVNKDANFALKDGEDSYGNSDSNAQGAVSNSEDNNDANIALDDVDGAMFSRAKPKYTDHGGHGLETRHILDESDGAMFSRKYEDRKGRNKLHHLRMKSTTFGNDDPIQREIPRSPSDGFLASARFSKLSANFPSPFSSEGNITQLDQPRTDLIDCGVDVVPDNLDNKNTNSNTTTLTSNDDEVSDTHDDVNDSVLFQRRKSTRTIVSTPNTSEMVNQETNRDSIGRSENSPTPGFPKSKSMPNLAYENEPASPSFALEFELEQSEQVELKFGKRSSFSLPTNLNDVTDVCENGPKTLTQSNDAGHEIVEDFITRETVGPLTSTPPNGRTSFSDAVPAGDHDDEATHNLLESSNQRPGCNRRPFRLKYIGSVLFPAISVVLFLADIGTDINLANRYRQDGDWLFFGVTVSCIVLPSLLMTVVDLSWIYVDRKSGDDQREHRNSYFNTRRWMALRIVIGVLSCGRVVRTIAHIYHSVRSKMYDDDEAQQRHKQRKIEERRDYCTLDVINAFTESCPQLIAQMVLLYKYNRPFNADLGVSIVLSWLSIGWAYSCYYRYQKESLHGHNDVRLVGIAVFCLAVLSALATRICCISMFLVYYSSWIGALALVVHFVVMWVWITFWQKPDLQGLTSSWIGRNLYCMFFAYLSIMYFVNLRNTPTRCRLGVFFLIYYVENFLAAGLLMLDTSIDSDYRWSMLIVPLGLLLHVCLLTLFYKCFHPLARNVRGNDGDANAPV